MSKDRRREWTVYCRRMAQLAYDMAEGCDDLELMRIYLMLGARWVNRGIDGPPTPRQVDLADMKPANRLVA